MPHQRKLKKNKTDGSEIFWEHDATDNLLELTF